MSKASTWTGTILKSTIGCGGGTGVTVGVGPGVGVKVSDGIGVGVSVDGSRVGAAVSVGVCVAVPVARGVTVGVGAAVLLAEFTSSVNLFGRRVRRSLDVLAGVVLMVLFAPAMAVIAWLVQRETDGSPVFQQTRVGYRGEPFTMYKFRTMRPDAEKTTGAVVAGENEGFCHHHAGQDDALTTDAGQQ